jgi:hypothetical protein
VNVIGPAGDRHSHSSIDVSRAPWITLLLVLAVTSSPRLPTLISSET